MIRSLPDNLARVLAVNEAFAEENTALRSKLAAAEAREAQLREAAKPFDALNDMLDTEDAVLGDEEYFYGSAKLGGVTYGDVRKLRRALSQPQSDYRERVRREAFEEAAKVADDFEARWDAQWRAEHKGSSHLEGKSDGAGEIASAIRALGDSNANG